MSVCFTLKLLPEVFRKQTQNDENCVSFRFVGQRLQLCPCKSWVRFLGILAWTNGVDLETVHTREEACQVKAGTEFNYEGCINAVIDKVCSGNCNGRGRAVVSAVIWQAVLQASADDFCATAEDEEGCVWLLSESKDCEDKRSFNIKKSSGSGHDLPQLPPKPSEKRSLNFDNLKNALKANRGRSGLLRKMLNIKK